MRTKVSSGAAYLDAFLFAVAPACIALYEIVTYKNTNDLLLIVLISLYFYAFGHVYLKMGNISSEDKCVYLKRPFFADEKISFVAIVRIKRVLGAYLRGSYFKFGYKMIYYNKEGKRKTCMFYIGLGNVPGWNRFKEALIQSNPSVEIVEEIF